MAPGPNASGSGAGLSLFIQVRGRGIPRSSRYQSPPLSPVPNGMQVKLSGVLDSSPVLMLQKRRGSDTSCCDLLRSGLPRISWGCCSLLQLALGLAMLHTSACKEERRMNPHQQSRWRRIGRQVLWAAGVIVAVSAVVFIVNRFFVHHPLWDWLKLLIVPAVLAGGAIWFNAQQREREQETANNRAQDETLQAYLDGMAELLTDRDRPLHRAQVGDSLSTVARARTLTVLARLEGKRKRSVVQFLYETGLIAADRLVLDLSGADLSGADLSGAILSGANLRKAILYQADLRGVWEWTADQLSKAKILEGAIMPNGQKYEDWVKSKDRVKGEEKNSGPS